MTASEQTGFLWGDKMKMSYTGDAAELCNREYTQAQSCVCKWGNGIIRIILQYLANKAPCKFRNQWNKGGEWEKKNETKTNRDFARDSQPSAGSAPTYSTKNATEIFSAGDSTCSRHTGSPLSPQQLFTQYVCHSGHLKHSSVTYTRGPHKLHFLDGT